MQISDRSLLYSGKYETISETRVGVFYLKVFCMQISFILLIGSGTLSDCQKKKFSVLTYPGVRFLKVPQPFWARENTSKISWGAFFKFEKSFLRSPRASRIAPRFRGSFQISCILYTEMIF